MRDVGVQIKRRSADLRVIPSVPTFTFTLAPASPSIFVWQDMKTVLNKLEAAELATCNTGTQFPSLMPR